MWARTTLLRSFLGLTAAITLTGRGVAELLNSYFPDSVPAFDPGDEPAQLPVVRDGPWMFLPALDLGAGFASNVPAAPRRRSTPQTIINPSLGVATDWPRDGFGAAASVRTTHDADAPSLDRTDVSLSAGGKIDVGANRLTLAASHEVQHEDPTQVGALAADRPIAVTIDDVRAAYTVVSGRWTLEPSMEAMAWSYGDTIMHGVLASQAYRDRVMLRGGTTLRYELAPKRDIVLAARVAAQDYMHTSAGQVRLDSVAEQLLAGIDYDAGTVWRWRVLAGAEHRQFASVVYPGRQTLIAEAAVTWTPTALTTINAVFARDTRDAAQEGVAGLTDLSARLTLDHEYARDLLVRLSVVWQQAAFFGGGAQTGTTMMTSVTKALNRQALVSFTLSQTDLRPARVPGGALAGGYSGGAGLISIRLGM